MTHNAPWNVGNYPKQMTGKPLSVLVTEVDTFRVLYTESRNMILDAQVAGLPVEEDLRVAELDAIQHLGWLDGEIQKRTGAVPDLKYSAYVGYDA